jgi:transposase
VQRWLFRRELEQLAPASVYYLDECGVDHRLYREYGRAPRGERIYETVAGRRRERTSIAACQNGKLVAPLTFAGTCNTEVVDAYFEQVLLPELPPGSVIVLDNARFHQSPTTAALVAAAGCQLFLPAYSPDLNPIEHLWAAVKTRLRQDLATAANPASFLSAQYAYVIVKCYRIGHLPDEPQGRAGRPVGDGLVQHAQVGLVERREVPSTATPPVSAGTVGNVHVQCGKERGDVGGKGVGAGRVHEIIKLQGLGLVGLPPDFAGELQVHPGERDAGAVDEPDAERGAFGRGTGGQQAQRAIGTVRASRS